MQSCSVEVSANFSALQLDATDLFSASASSQRDQVNSSHHLLVLDIHMILRDPLLLLCSLCSLISLSLDSLFSFSPKFDSHGFAPSPSGRRPGQRRILDGNVLDRSSYSHHRGCNEDLFSFQDQSHGY